MKIDYKITRRLLFLLISVSFLACQTGNNEGKTNLEEKEIAEIISDSVDISLSLENASSFASLALNCIQNQYPYKLGQVLGDESYLKSPKELHPSFYGCFDWHSAVHGHWMLIRLMKEFPGLPEEEEIRRKIGENLNSENIAVEASYFDDPHNKNFERTYGWAWLLQLAHELMTWDDPQASEWSANLKPLTDLIVNKYLEFLPKLNYPIRVGEHPNTAFGMSFAYDYAVASGNDQLRDLIRRRCLDYYSEDKDCPIEWEPGGFDFLSPCLEEANMMRRVLDKEEFRNWVTVFLPSLLSDFQLAPASVTDRSDGKLVHLDGVNLSRAWCLYGISKALDNNVQLRNIADEHLRFTLPNIASGEYSGEHWLGSFAVYALSQK